jgi:glycogen debranching enzyme
MSTPHPEIVSDISEILDLRDSVPDLLPYLLPGERVINVIQSGEQEKDLDAPPSPLNELYRLAGARIFGSEIEFPRPVHASVAHSDSDDENLHLYETLFGRDSLRVAQDVLPVYPQLARVTILGLAHLQGTGANLYNEEEVGKIIHEARDPHSPIAQRLTEQHGWQWPYYGSIDATPTYISTLVRYVKHTKEHESFLETTYEDKSGNIQSMKHSFDLAVEWLLEKIESTNGLLEFKPGFQGSIPNQVWKDSPDSYFHEDGTIANHKNGVSSIETQCIAYDALKEALELYELIGEEYHTERIKAAIEAIEDVTFSKFWVHEKGGYFALGLDHGEDGELRPMKIRTSNMGHVLSSQLLMGDEPHKVQVLQDIIHQLFSPELLAPAGIRTLASDEIRYRPRAYHNGSVWPWDSYMIAQGLQRHGYYGLGREIVQRVELTMHTTRGYPEYVSGDTGIAPSVNKRVIDIWDPALNDINRIEQPPQETQAWSVAAIIAIDHATPFIPMRATDEYKAAFENTILESLRSEAA